MSPLDLFVKGRFAFLGGSDIGINLAEPSFVLNLVFLPVLALLLFVGLGDIAIHATDILLQRRFERIQTGYCAASGIYRSAGEFQGYERLMLCHQFATLSVKAKCALEPAPK